MDIGAQIKGKVIVDKAIHAAEIDFAGTSEQDDLNNNNPAFDLSGSRSLNVSGENYKAVDLTEKHHLTPKGKGSYHVNKGVITLTPD